MVIDAHVHIGSMLNFKMTPEIVLESAKKYNIDYMLVSNSESVEVDHSQNLIPKEYMISQEESARRAIEFAKNNPDKIGVLLWVKPLTEKVTDELRKLIEDNRKYVFGIKLHPYHSKVGFDDPRVEEYIKLAAEFDMPVMSHGAGDDYSNPIRVYNMAKKYPGTDFIIAHMGLGTDNQESIKYIKELPNLYGDTAWVMPDKTLQAIRECGPEKILFGTDNPIDGVDTYAHKEMCSVYLNSFRDMVSKEEYEMLMYKNAIRVFKLNL